MSKRLDRQSFADIVRDVESKPPNVPPTRNGPGLYADGVLIDQDGREYSCVDEDIGSARAHALASDGAAVVWDPCGCGGGCGLDWYSAEDVKDMAASGPPSVRNTKRKRGHISEWRSEAGAALLLAEDAVRWADRMA